MDRLGEALADRYRVEREVGAGGMATVYLAHDLKHGRDVALKVLRSDLGTALGPERFLAEIRTTARLQHPHILAVFDSGEAAGHLWYTMPFVEGETLRARLTRAGRLPLPVAVQIARDIAAALAHAHERGVVHRDVKPENVLLTPQGQALVMDFGIAKAFESADANLTATGVGLGTPSYMAPEQVMGERPIQLQADVYALGVVLHEMLAGERPFADGAPVAMLARRLTEGAPSVATVRPDVPPAVAALIQHALEVDPAKRPASATSFSALLRDAAAETGEAASTPVPVRAARLSTAAKFGIGAVTGAALVAAFVMSRRNGDHETSLAVLPFANRDTSQAYLSDGLAEDLAVRLSQVQGLRIAPQSSTRRLRGSDETPEALAKKLDVSHVLTGTLARLGDSIRISLELVDAARRKQQWSEVRTVPQRNLAMFVDSMARSITASLLPGARAATPGQGPVTHDPLAYNYYLLGQHHWNRFTPMDLSRSLAYFDSALARDPVFVAAWIGRAGALMAMASGNGNLTARDALAPLRQALDTIVVLDPRSAVAHAIRGHVYTWFEWDWDAAGREFRQAIALGPHEPLVALRASFYQMAIGGTDSALALLAIARQVDPTNPRVVVASATAAFLGRRYEACLSFARRGLDLEPQFPPGFQYEALCLSALGRHAEAVRIARTAAAVARQPLMLSTLAIVLAQADSVSASRLVVAELEGLGKHQSFDAGLVFRPYAALNDRDQFFFWLDRAVADRSYQVSLLNVDPVTDPVRSDPRYASALARAGVPRAPSTTP